MAVVINEFEVVADAPPDRSGPGEQPEEQAAPMPQDIEQIVRRQLERAARVRAD